MSLIFVMILVPIIICVFVENPTKRISVIMTSLVIFLIVLSTLVTRKTHELILAGAT